jgi:divalent metal cation (Fe/Co/Zn/Cd) transporter
MGYLEAVHRGKDPTIFVVLFEDSAAMAGLVVAAVGIALGQATGIHEFDGAASIVIGLILGTVAIWLAVETKGLLIGESASAEIRRRLGQVVRSHEGIAALNELVTLHMGPESILVAISVDFADGLSSEQVEASVAALNRRIREAAPQASRVFIEVESFRAHRAQVADFHGSE